MQKHFGSERPYSALGTYLKQIREGKNESVAEVSGAVEIDIEELESIERGIARPSEDILMLLINHFEMQDQEAVHLWESAGYESDEAKNGRNRVPRMTMDTDKAAIVVLALDARTLYSDEATIMANENGLAVTFLDNSESKSVPVSKIGMSYEHAEKLVTALTKTIMYGKHQAAQKRLPPKKHYN